MDLTFSLEIILMLTAVAALAGFIDAIAGGGGLLTIPAMLLTNIPQCSRSAPISYKLLLAHWPHPLL